MRLSEKINGGNTSAFLSSLNESANITESVSWSYFDKFNDIADKYLPDRGEGDTIASQLVAAVNKLIYKWYNDGDVYDNVNSGLDGWANDLSSYANWIYKNIPETQELLESIYQDQEDDEYEELLKDLADMTLNDSFLAPLADKTKTGSIYNCDGPFKFEEKSEQDEEY